SPWRANSSLQYDWMLLTKPTARQSARLLASAPVRHCSFRLLVASGISVDCVDGATEVPRLEGSTPRRSATTRITRPSPPPPTATAVPGPRPRRSSTCDVSRGDCSLNGIDLSSPTYFFTVSLSRHARKLR